jgi:hypothetical protein
MQDVQFTEAGMNFMDNESSHTSDAVFRIVIGHWVLKVQHYVSDKWVTLGVVISGDWPAACLLRELFEMVIEKGWEEVMSNKLK